MICGVFRVILNDLHLHIVRDFKIVYPPTWPSTMSSDSLVLFNSSTALYFQLSNFNHANVTIKRGDLDSAWIELNPFLETFFVDENETIEFLSIEHLWHALKATDRLMFREFAIGGRFGGVDRENFAQVFSDDEADAKLKWWMKKQNVGIIPKMAANKSRGKKLGISTRMDYERERPAPDLEKRIWLALLRRKYNQNAEHRRLLLKTRNAKLIEFARGAARANSNEHWGGCLVDGRVVGENVMGGYLEEVRNEIQNSTE